MRSEAATVEDYLSGLPADPREAIGSVGVDEFIGRYEVGRKVRRSKKN
jgi:hypothetical protein